MLPDDLYQRSSRRYSSKHRKHLNLSNRLDNYFQLQVSIFLYCFFPYSTTYRDRKCGRPFNGGKRKIGVRGATGTSFICCSARFFIYVNLCNRWIQPIALVQLWRIIVMHWSCSCGVCANWCLKRNLARLQTVNHISHIAERYLDSKVLLCCPTKRGKPMNWSSLISVRLTSPTVWSNDLLARDRACERLAARARLPTSSQMALWPTARRACNAKRRAAVVAV